MSDGKRPIELPARRISRGQRIALESGHTLFLHCGFDVDGVVREIFISCRRASSEFARMLTDQAMGASYRLQYGPRLTELRPRSEVMQEVLRHAIEIERDCAADVIAEYQRYVVPTVMVSA